MRLFDSKTIHDLHWPASLEYEKNYLLPFLLQDTKTFISNLNTNLYILQMDEQLIPLTVNDEEYENSYVCSPYTGYVTYGKQELWKLHQPALEYLLNGLLNGVGRLLKRGQINKIVCVNNWMLSTNLYPKWEGKNIRKLTQFLIENFPDHVIVFRSLNEYSNSSLMKELVKDDYHLVPSREIFIFDKLLKKYINKRNTLNDRKLLERTSYQKVSHEEITSQDYQRIAELYYLLYFGKYSTCSARFTDKFMQLCHEKKLLNMQGVRNSEGTLEGIVGSFVRNGVMATPLVGYNTSIPREKGLFRLITMMALKEAFEKEYIFNISAGISQFKKWRGAVGFIEYSAVYHKHLPLKRKVVWNVLQCLMTAIGVPLLHKYQF